MKKEKERKKETKILILMTVHVYSSGGSVDKQRRMAP
jgi:hypothetical protein